jgi:hypothetical protein
MKTEIVYHDHEYKNAINYDGTNYYNAPCTLIAKGVMYVLNIGASDMIRTKIRNGVIYLIAMNTALEYISLTVIDTKTKQIDSLFCGNGELSYNPYNLKKSIFEYSTNYQIRVMKQYL